MASRNCLYLLKVFSVRAVFTYRYHLRNRELSLHLQRVSWMPRCQRVRLYSDAGATGHHLSNRLGSHASVPPLTDPRHHSPRNREGFLKCAEVRKLKLHFLLLIANLVKTLILYYTFQAGSYTNYSGELVQFTVSFKDKFSF